MARAIAASFALASNRSTSTVDTVRPAWRTSAVAKAIPVGTVRTIWRWSERGAQSGTVLQRDSERRRRDRPAVGHAVALQVRAEIEHPAFAIRGRATEELAHRGKDLAGPALPVLRHRDRSRRPPPPPSSLPAAPGLYRLGCEAASDRAVRPRRGEIDPRLMPLEVHNGSRPSYNVAAATDTWDRTLDWLARNTA